MKIIDHTPYRNAKGEIDLIGRVRSYFTHGLTWHDRVQAQDAAIAILEKALGEKYILLRNVTLYNTEIELPLVLIGPQGLFVINVLHERGVFRVKDDEWGTASGEKFVPAGINQVQRTIKLGRVLQVYLERAGFKEVMIDPVLMSANPGTHIEAVRPAVRVIMSDALERFAISLAQGQTILDGKSATRITKAILGTGKEEEAALAAPQASPGESIPQDSFSLGPGDAESEAFSYSFDDKLSAYQVDSPLETGTQTSNYQERGLLGSASQEFEFGETDSNSELSQAKKVPPFQSSQPETGSQRRVKTPARKKGPLGLTTGQLALLIGMLLFWLCAVLGFAAYIYFTMYA